MSQPHDAEESLHSREFHRLASRKNVVSLILTLVTMAAYYGYIYLIAFHKDLVGAKVTANVTWGIPLGVGVILISWLTTGIYVTWANRRYDGMADEMRKRREA